VGGRTAARAVDARTGARTAARIVRQMPAPDATRLLTAMSGQGAAEVLTELAPESAADLLRADAGLRESVLPLVPEPERTFIIRYLD
ncbi:MAG: hypothetical protein J2P25_08085, partial [Nocardiopsaceae bacterium]|nr:hypothetical protein [Nocardiopsaceae bacterium]